VSGEDGMLDPAGYFSKSCLSFCQNQVGLKVKVDLVLSGSI